MLPILLKRNADSHHPHDSFQFAYGEVSVVICPNILMHIEHGMWEYVTGVLKDTTGSPTCFHAIIVQVQIFTPAALVSWPR